MNHDPWMQLGGLAILFVFSAFFSGSETALMSMNRLRVKYLVQKKRRGAMQLDHLLKRPDRLLGAILVGNNLVNIAASVFATTFFVQLYGDQGELLTILILTPLLLILAEICPKTYAAERAERVSFLVLRPIQIVMVVLAPVVWLVTGVARQLTRIFHRDEERPVISEDELRTLISVGEESGVVAASKRRMLHRVFELSHIRVRDVMIPRTEVIGFEVNTPFEEVLKLTQDARHSRFPVFEENLDSIVGVIHSKDILNFVGRAGDFSLREVARPPYFVPESKPIETLLQSFQKKRIHLAIVVDEYGGVEGIVTLEDIVEEIVGEIEDEYDVEEVLFREVEARKYLVDGSASLRTVNRRFGLNLSEEHANTLAGFLLRTMGQIPREGDQCERDGTVFTVTRVVDRRVEEVEMALPPPPEEPQER